MTYDDDNPYRPPAIVEPRATQAVLSDATEPLDLGGPLIGLNLVYYGIVGVLLSMIALVICAMLPLVAFVALPGLIGAYLMVVIGPFFCLAVPVETGARKLVVGSIVMHVSAIAASVASFARIEMQIVAPLIGNVCSVLSAALFVLFMRTLALYIGRTDLGTRATRLLLLGMLQLVVTSSVVLYSFLAPQASLVFWAVPGILCLVIFVQYANLINALRSALRPGTATVSF